jgi:hypothetical protein
MTGSLEGARKSTGFGMQISTKLFFLMIDRTLKMQSAVAKLVQLDLELDILRSLLIGGANEGAIRRQVKTEIGSKDCRQFPRTWTPIQDLSKEKRSRLVVFEI